MHSDGSACITSSSCDPLISNQTNADWMPQGAVRRRKLPKFCLPSDSSNHVATNAYTPQPSWDLNSSVTDLQSLTVPKTNHSPLCAHRRSASYGGDYFTFAAHEIGEAASRAVEQAEEFRLFSDLEYLISSSSGFKYTLARENGCSGIFYKRHSCTWFFMVVSHSLLPFRTCW
ncbi:unnamed protein product [Schistosoma margrebowiei]|uniref:Uncharacterized protein n=1 Tax=Schistosoma margrebowiei TaxID=48269 RepID=A0A183LZI2_9TREM|nr:unnamed protein product [Schistosoma margrebowiei]